MSVGITKGTMYYLASPYQSFIGGAPGGLGRLEEAYRLACLAAAELVKQGMVVISPVAHSHGIARFGGLGGDAETWRAQNEALTKVCDACIVLMLPGWRDGSVMEEIAIFEGTGKPVLYMHWPSGFIGRNERGLSWASAADFLETGDNLVGEAKA